MNDGLRTGYTTGACATACALAAGRRVLGLPQGDSVSILLPRGQRVAFALEQLAADPAGGWRAATIKDAGDDPDVTHGARVWVRVQRRPEPGVGFHAGEGVGRVTRNGLALAVGEPAINPVPRRMLAEHLEQVAGEGGYSGGWELWVGVDGGAELALRTMNPRLGILGGLSILGTTGIVRPYSCSAFVASIHQGIDVARANGLTHLAACTGSTSEAAAMALLGLPEMAVIEMGDLAGAVLKYLRRHPVERLTLAGGVGKLSKLAAGHLDLHSRRSQADKGFLAELVAADEDLHQRIIGANTVSEAVAIADAGGHDLAAAVCRRAAVVARGHLGDAVALDLLIIDRQGRVLARCP